jgi:hypothetical protein
MVLDSYTLDGYKYGKLGWYMDQHEEKIFLANLVAAFRTTQRYMKRNYMPGKGMEKTAPRS